MSDYTVAWPDLEQNPGADTPLGNTTAETPTTPAADMERLARAACYGDETVWSGCRCTDAAACQDWVGYEEIVKAILAEQRAMGYVIAKLEGTVS